LFVTEEGVKALEQQEKEEEEQANFNRKME
jgi:hypothetical protein